MRPAVPAETLSSLQARRVALAAGGLAAAARSGPPTAGAVRRVVQRLGAVQIDSVNVLVRAHYLPVFSRLGRYDRALLDRAGARPPRRLFEYWGHEASLLPVELEPLLRWRMARAHEDAWGGMRRVARERPDLVALVRREVADRGPLTAPQLERAVAEDAPRPVGGWGWNWSEVKRALEYLFWSGEVSAAWRGPGFERWYDLPERVLPHSVRTVPTPSVDEAQRALVEIAARASGVSAEPELRDYFRLSLAETRRAVAALVEEGVLLPVTVQGWTRPAYLHRDARPRRAPAAALLGPFDPLLWDRGRVERLFGFRFRLEIYVPRAQRVHGYYVLPFLLGDRLVARVDLKADRGGRALLVQAAHAEPGAPPETVPALVGELRRLGGWLDLDGVVAAARGDLGPAVAGALGRGGRAGAG